MDYENEDRPRCVYRMLLQTEKQMLEKIVIDPVLVYTSGVRSSQIFSIQLVFLDTRTPHVFSVSPSKLFPYDDDFKSPPVTSFSKNFSFYIVYTTREPSAERYPVYAGVRAAGVHSFLLRRSASHWRSFSTKIFKYTRNSSFFNVFIPRLVYSYPSTDEFE